MKRDFAQPCYEGGYDWCERWIRRDEDAIRFPAGGQEKKVMDAKKQPGKKTAERRFPVVTNALPYPDG
jgi:hypothetical protein